MMINKTKSTKERRSQIILLIAILLIIITGVNFGSRLGEYIKSWWAGEIHLTPDSMWKDEEQIPISKLPGPSRTKTKEFYLDENNSKLMIGMDGPETERWSDICGNYYSSKIADNFSYNGSKPRTPEIRVKIEPKGITFTGRLEARKLKPNFVYQIKILGDYNHFDSYMKIGRTGRWRLPGKATNYTEEDFQNAPDNIKEKTEAYILFDYLVTDQNGDAIRDFSLDSSLHVIWKVSQRSKGVLARDVLGVIIQCNNPDVYLRPKPDPMIELLWAEREMDHYTKDKQKILLPPGKYKASLILTEESFHSRDNDGGWWATVAKLPVEFEIIEEKEEM